MAPSLDELRKCSQQARPIYESALSEDGPSPASAGFEVMLHVYDLGPMAKWLLNSWAGPGGGAFHCGVEVLGIEWSYQALTGYRVEEDADVSGLTWHQPRSHPRHVYRESVHLGSCVMSIPEISRLLDGLARTWLARSYHFLNNNCTDFAEHLISRLCPVGKFPAWVHGLAKGIALAPSSQSPATSSTSSGTVVTVEVKPRQVDEVEEIVQVDGKAARASGGWGLVLSIFPMFGMCCGSCASAESCGSQETFFGKLDNGSGAVGLPGGTVFSDRSHADSDRSVRTGESARRPLPSERLHGGDWRLTA